MQVLSILFNVLYWVIGLTVAARAILMVVAYTKIPVEKRKETIIPFLLTVVVEAGLQVVVSFSFALSKTGLLSVAALCFFLYLIRHMAPFEKTATQHIYSLLMMWFPQKRIPLNKALSMHLF